MTAIAASTLARSEWAASAVCGLMAARIRVIHVSSSVTAAVIVPLLLEHLHGPSSVVRDERGIGPGAGQQFARHRGHLQPSGGGVVGIQLNGCLIRFGGATIIIQGRAIQSLPAYEVLHGIPSFR
jgi:hypothetical protein